MDDTWTIDYGYINRPGLWKLIVTVVNHPGLQNFVSDETDSLPKEGVTVVICIPLARSQVVATLYIYAICIPLVRSQVVATLYICYLYSLS